MQAVIFITNMSAPCRSTGRKGKSLILTNDQSEGLHDGVTCAPEHSIIALGEVSFCLMKDILSQYIHIYWYSHLSLLILPSFHCNYYSLHGEM